MATPCWTMHTRPGPVVMTALHHGHDLREEIVPFCHLSPAQRLREEDPHTGDWTCWGDTRVVVHRSRFEVDLNRSVSDCVYRTPAAAWGLQVWKSPLPAALVARSQEIHRRFYAEMAGLLQNLLDCYGSFVLLDMHSYNHRRQGPLAPPADPLRNPDVDLLIPEREQGPWQEVLAMVTATLRQTPMAGPSLQVGFNTRFQRAAFGDWVANRYGERALVLVMEFKKTFMDEWTGELHADRHEALNRGVGTCVERLRDHWLRKPPCNGSHDKDGKSGRS